MINPCRGFVKINIHITQVQVIIESLAEDPHTIDSNFRQHRDHIDQDGENISHDDVEALVLVGELSHLVFQADEYVRRNIGVEDADANGEVVVDHLISDDFEGFDVDDEGAQETSESDHDVCEKLVIQLFIVVNSGSHCGARKTDSLGI